MSFFLLIPLFISAISAFQHPLYLEALKRNEKNIEIYNSSDPYIDNIEKISFDGQRLHFVKKKENSFIDDILDQSRILFKIQRNPLNIVDLETTIRKYQQITNETYLSELLETLDEIQQRLLSLKNPQKEILACFHDKKTHEDEYSVVFKNIDDSSQNFFFKQSLEVIGNLKKITDLCQTLKENYERRLALKLIDFENTFIYKNRNQYQKLLGYELIMKKPFKLHSITFPIICNGGRIFLFLFDENNIVKGKMKNLKNCKNQEKINVTFEGLDLNFNKKMGIGLKNEGKNLLILGKTKEKMKKTKDF